MAPGEILVPLRLGLDRLPAHRRLGPAERPRRILPRRDDDGADRETHRRARQARFDGPRLSRLALRPAVVELVEPQRGVGRQCLETAAAGQRLVDHLLRRHFDQLHRHRLPIGRLLLLGVELIGQRPHQRGLLRRVGDGQRSSPRVDCRGGRGRRLVRLLTDDHERHHRQTTEKQRGNDGSQNRAVRLGLFSAHGRLLTSPHSDRTSAAGPAARHGWVKPCGSCAARSPRHPDPPTS